MGEYSNSSFPNDSIFIVESKDLVREEMYAWMVSVPSLVFMSVCICANIITFIFVCSCRTYRSPANYLLANLCFVSTIFILNSIILNFERRIQLWPYGPYTCIIVSSFHRLPLPLMTLAIMALSVDRSRIARNPLNHPSKSKVILQILLVWALSFLLTIPRALSSEYVPESVETVKCRKIPFLNNRWAQVCFATVNFLVIYALPALHLIKELRKTRRQMKYLASCQSEQCKSFTRRSRLMRNSCIFTCFFVTCWLPLGILQLPFDLVSPEPISWAWLNYPRNVSYIVVMIQACINPLLVQILSFDVQEFLTSCCCGKD